MPNVLEIKAAVRIRDGQCCVDCGMTAFEHVLTFGKTLEVHRKNPGSEYAEDGCETLCRSCHDGKPKSTYGSMVHVYGGTIRVPVALYEALRKLAEKNDRPVQRELLRAIKEYLAKNTPA